MDILARRSSWTRLPGNLLGVLSPTPSHLSVSPIPLTCYAPRFLRFIARYEIFISSILVVHFKILQKAGSACVGQQYIIRTRVCKRRCTFPIEGMEIQLKTAFATISFDVRYPLICGLDQHPCRGQCMFHL